MDKDFSENANSFNPYMNMGSGLDVNEMYKDPMFNPIMQYSQSIFPEALTDR